jgi:hypothetical protein
MIPSETRLRGQGPDVRDGPDIGVRSNHVVAVDFTVKARNRG